MRWDEATGRDISEMRCQLSLNEGFEEGKTTAFPGKEAGADNMDLILRTGPSQRA